MNSGFYIILAAQFFSALADNALLFAAIALLKDLDAPAWQIPVLQISFVASYILLAPFVGAFADSLPKGRVMLISNTIKLCGCLTMLDDDKDATGGDDSLSRTDLHRFIIYLGHEFNDRLRFFSELKVEHAWWPATAPATANLKWSRPGSKWT